jgi:hypothetical protein
MINRTFNCTQQELYSVCNLGWQSCQQQLPAFADFKARYTAAYITQMLAQVATAQNMPDAQARNADREGLRIQLTQQLQACLGNWQRLKRYIADAFTLDLQKPNLEAAGQKYYTQAANADWEAAQALLVSGSNFIANKLAQLTAAQNMPASFQAGFDEVKQQYEALYLQFVQSEEAARVETENKVIANNDIHAKLMNMFLDGQEIFKDNEALKRQFTFEQVLLLVSGPGAAGLKGMVTDSVTGSPLANVQVSLLPGGRIATSNNDGHYAFAQLSANSYTVLFAAAGYQPFTLQLQVLTSVTHTSNVQLSAA